METGWLLQLLRVVLLFSFACTSSGADGPSAPAAVLHASGKVKVNGSDSRKITTLFRGDSVQTNADSLANISAGGSSVLVMPNASVKFLGNLVEVEEGGVTIATSVGMAAEADGVTVAPAAEIQSQSQKQSRFKVAETEDFVVVAALQGNVAVSDGQQTSTTQEGQETTHKKKRKGGGAIPGATKSLFTVRNIAIVGGAAVAGGLLLDEINDTKRCVSPPGGKKCKCKIDKNGNQTCSEED